MIPQQDLSWQSRDWQTAQADLVTHLDELLTLLDLELEQLPERLRASQDFPLRVPREYIHRMRRGDPTDPLLLQVLPDGRETLDAPGFSADPVAESHFSPVPGILHKYRGRALVMATSACAIHCRYCFRRHFPYDQHLPRGATLDTMLEWFSANPDVREVILSGGDPLSVSDRRLEEFWQALASVPSLTRLRIHTRMPVVIPQRITDTLLEILTRPRFQSVVVLHANHPAELDEHFRVHINRLRQSGVTVLNQSVLLAGINDDAATLADLSERLMAAGVLPYYLHLLDPVAGSAHFLVSEVRARAVYRSLQALLPGYLVPRLVREVPERQGKTLVPA